VRLASLSADKLALPLPTRVRGPIATPWRDQAQAVRWRVLSVYPSLFYFERRGQLAMLAARQALPTIYFDRPLMPHSITSVAVASNVSGTVRPSALAVLRLMTNSNLVGCRTGRSAGFSPLRMRPT
jgi:hypothetical protein